MKRNYLKKQEINDLINLLNKKYNYYSLGDDVWSPLPEIAGEIYKNKIRRDNIGISSYAYPFFNLLNFFKKISKTKYDMDNKDLFIIIENLHLSNYDITTCLENSILGEVNENSDVTLTYMKLMKKYPEKINQTTLAIMYNTKHSGVFYKYFGVIKDHILDNELQSQYHAEKFERKIKMCGFKQETTDYLINLLKNKKQIKINKKIKIENSYSRKITNLFEENELSDFLMNLVIKKIIDHLDEKKDILVLNDVYRGEINFESNDVELLNKITDFILKIENNQFLFNGKNEDGYLNFENKNQKIIDMLYLDMQINNQQYSEKKEIKIKI